MKIALLQLNPTVGDLAGNKDLIARAIRRAPDFDLAVTSELALPGYPPCDLLLNEEFVERSWQALNGLAEELDDLPPVLVGLAEPDTSAGARPLFNSAALIRDGKVTETFQKSMLSGCDLFQEGRYFQQGKEPRVLQIEGQSLGILIGELLLGSGDNERQDRPDPIAELRAKGADAIVNLSASPFTAGKQLLREARLSDLARKHCLPILSVNQVGGNDDLIFDGRSCFFDAAGRLIARGRGFEEDIIVADLDEQKEIIATDDFTFEAEIWRALVLGTRDYVHKCGFSSVLLGLSGGIDSSLVAAIAVQALGPNNVLGVLLPSPYTRQSSIDDALALAANLGIKTISILLTDIMGSFELELAEHFAGRPKDITEENIQARIRATLLMALSNKYGSILLATGNRSELSVGYCTIYGDMAGGLAVISDLPKTMVYRIAEWLNSTASKPVIPPSIIKKPPSAELRPGQTDQDSLPPYPLLDEILKRYIDEHQSRADLLRAGLNETMVDRVISLVKNAEFKRVQAALGLKVIDKSFGEGWRMPVACRIGQEKSDFK
ncbi:MAG: NAD+ synthase [Methanothrix sp.]|jgi:NAD+ synthase/NAD+ synthase (glutamine-hydrolysing)|uniref:NAD+ synthase n=3 Tax=Methanothrix TaxID=2222 RepID=UPI0025DAE7BD|nr:NAD+ synthase [Methanothrix sp.]MCK9405108.1 NAD+ synthase [Methanothrix sp.]